MTCAIGLRAHSGWAAAVAIVAAGAGEEPVLILRDRIEMTDPAIDGAKAPYHAAEKMELGAAAAFLERCEAASRGLARSGLSPRFPSFAPRSRRTRSSTSATASTSARPWRPRPRRAGWR
jgi:hypothetical protein